MSENIIAQFDYVNSSEGWRLGTDGPLETRFNTKGELYRHCQLEYGRCVSKCFVGDGLQIGWVFEKRQKYDDCNEYFILETWVTVHNSMPVKSIKYDYAEF